MRGYLWERLATEVIREFDQFGCAVDAEEIAAVGGYTVGTLAGFDMWARHEELRLDRALGPELLARLRARRREVVNERRAELRAQTTRAERMREYRARLKERRYHVPAAPTRQALAQRECRARKAHRAVDAVSTA